MSDSPLYLLHLRPDARLLAAWVARHHARHERQPSDLGDALHGLLRAAFGDAAPQPFRYLDERQGLLAYTRLDAEAMRAHVERAEGLVAETLGLRATALHDGFRLRPFPTRWPEGRVLGFEVRVCPTVRTANGERNAYQRADDHEDDAPARREAAYVQWLLTRLDVPEGGTRENWQGAVELLPDVHLAAYQRQRTTRRTQAIAGRKRERHVIDNPDAVLKGHLRVRDPAAFAHLLARGVGRHRAFGFGMLLLSPAA
ncbi:type I-E CRISPR-associated protein Cas6/Cse3/CasE [uncultured Pseudacidovorax sp.]|uniref:type I-E CRISPR-associated protein Cas6/Cse3/CasE n=1 Tax=uncultured Pseudacidovorax sp. TaxID=679313 RepID=UPI0025F32602|nr:type I-E CRISPR-associated protein Cas6/Cse3/CasE [uncultured Pseudacidovorax sp.]